eukprot:12356294-Heterocapsa_arctica.AAC.1
MLRGSDGRNGHKLMVMRSPWGDSFLWRSDGGARPPGRRPYLRISGMLHAFVLCVSAETSLANSTPRGAVSLAWSMRCEWPLTARME